MKALDDNARLMNGTLPADPFDDAIPFDAPPESKPRRPVRPVNDAPRSWADRLVTVDTAWLSEALPPREYLAIDTRTSKGAIPVRGVGLLGAAGGVGKSFATLGLALAVATGTTWLGIFRICRTGRVLIVSAEDPADEIRRRLFALGAALDYAPADVNGRIDVVDAHDMHLPLLAANGTPTEHAHALVQLARARGPYALVIVDPLARISGASIDADNVAAGSLVSALEAVGTAADGLVLGVHHTSQGARRGGIVDATALRGATALGDSARLVIVLTVETVDMSETPQWSDLGEIVTMTRAKANHVARWEPIQLRRGEHGELLPLDGGASEIIGRARRASAPAARKREQREAEREAKEARENCEREQREVERTAKAEARARELRGAVLAAVAEQPGVSGAQLEIAVRARGIGAQASAIRLAIESARADGEIEIRPGRRGALSHWPRVSVSSSSLKNPPIPPCKSEADEDEVETSSPLSKVDEDEVDEDEVDEVKSAGDLPPSTVSPDWWRS